MIEFHLLNGSEKDDYARWAEEHPGGSLFHSSHWIDFVCREQGGSPRIYRVLRNGDFFGYWHFILVKKGPFRMLGSPLRGWLTSKMGPLLAEPAGPEIIKAVKDLCLQERIAYFETAGELLREDTMRLSGFSVKTRETWILDLASDETEQWNRLHYNCRKNIKKAQRCQVEIRELDDDEYFKPLYDLVVKTFRSKNLLVPFRFERLALLKDTVGKAGRLLFLGAFHKGEFAGGHIWGYDKKTAYALVSAARMDLSSYRINNLLLWEGIKRFIKMNLKTYDMYGGGNNNKGVARFKASFGSRYQASPHFSMNFSNVFSKLLNFYENHYLKVKSYPPHL